MKKALLFLIVLTSIRCTNKEKEREDGRFYSVTLNITKENLGVYWRDDFERLLRNIGGLKRYVESKGKSLHFAVNAGMFEADLSPKGLFIQNRKLLKGLDTSSGGGNFYLKPNGVFYITADKSAVVCRTEDYPNGEEIMLATQSGPMLLINGKIHPAFKEGSNNKQIRNGVGVISDSMVVFAISRVPVSFYDFAVYFQQMKCTNALYLDGFVSKIYLPKKGIEQLDGELGPMIGSVR